MLKKGPRLRDTWQIQIRFKFQVVNTWIATRALGWRSGGVSQFKKVGSLELTTICQLKRTLRLHKTIQDNIMILPKP